MNEDNENNEKNEKNENIRNLNDIIIDDNDLDDSELNSTINIRLNKSIDFLSEENKYFRNKINQLDCTIKQLRVKVNCYKLLFSNNESEKKDSVYCVICMDNTRNVLFRPCNHFVICDKCSGSSNITECIICKATIDSYEYAYLV